jgi:hypothetical protein
VLACSSRSGKNRQVMLSQEFEPLVPIPEELSLESSSINGILGAHSSSMTLSLSTAVAYIQSIRSSKDLLLVQMQE